MNDAVFCRKRIVVSVGDVLLGAIGAPVLRVGVCPADLSLHHRGIVSRRRGARVAGLTASIERRRMAGWRGTYGEHFVCCLTACGVCLLWPAKCRRRGWKCRDGYWMPSDAREPPDRVKPGIGFFVPQAPIPSRPPLAPHPGPSARAALQQPAPAWCGARAAARSQEAATATHWQLQLRDQPLLPTRGCTPIRRAASRQSHEHRVGHDGRTHNNGQNRRRSLRAGREGSCDACRVDHKVQSPGITSCRTRKCRQ